jgi:hypothetical protein
MVFGVGSGFKFDNTHWHVDNNNYRCHNDSCQCQYAARRRPAQQEVNPMNKTIEKLRHDFQGGADALRGSRASWK